MKMKTRLESTKTVSSTITVNKYCLINIKRLLINDPFWNVTRTILFET